MKKIFLTLFLLVALPVMATHIVGGEFELIHISGNTYKLNMILYFDKKNGNQGAKDPSAVVGIFRKSDNLQMATYTLPRISETEVQYAQPACSDGSIETTKIVYSLDIILSQTVYTDPSGYYVSWQRCCRNYSILNVFSPSPPSAITTDRTRYAGQTFYLEFPPVVKNGEPFIDSTPRLFPPLSDYACPFRPYYVDFGGVDDDGD
ncbi:MAG: gliding motility-associated C-terminal domain-containing protein, partial [Flammeovirgaceae bacterium]